MIKYSYEYVDGARVILCMYVDNFFIFDTSLDVINNKKLFTKSNFDIKDFEVNVILGIKITNHGNRIFLDHSNYIEESIEKIYYVSSF